MRPQNVNASDEALLSGLHQSINLSEKEQETVDWLDSQSPEYIARVVAIALVRNIRQSEGLSQSDIDLYSQILKNPVFIKNMAEVLEERGYEGLLAKLSETLSGDENAFSSFVGIEISQPVDFGIDDSELDI